MRPTVTSDSGTILRGQPQASSKDRGAQLFRRAHALPGTRLRDLAIGPGAAGGSPASLNRSSDSAVVRPSRQQRARSPAGPRRIIARHLPRSMPRNADGACSGPSRSQLFADSLAAAAAVGGASASSSGQGSAPARTGLRCPAQTRCRQGALNGASRDAALTQHLRLRAGEVHDGRRNWPPHPPGIED